MEAVEDVKGLRSSLGNDLHEWAPHVGGDEAERATFLGPEPVEESLKAFDGALLADPQEPLAMLVDLIDQGDVGVPLPESNLVGTDRADSGKIPMGQSPSDGHGHGLVHHVPCGLERLGRLGPGEPLRPSGQKPRIGLRQGTLGVLRKRPGKAFHPNAAPGTLHSPRCINQHDGNPPEGKIGESSNRLSPMA